jgi:hypothetical protein
MKAFMKLLPEGTDTAQYQTQLSQIEQMALTERNQSPNP